MAPTKRRKVAEAIGDDEEDDQQHHLNSNNNHDPPPADDHISGDDPDEEEPDDEGADEQQQQPPPTGTVDDDDISKLLEPLSKDQLVSLLRSAAASDPNILTEIRRLADLDPSHRKIFVHGLNWNTDADTLRSFFSQYGEIDDCRVVTDRASGKSKGYGFVLFHHRSSARHALEAPQKLIDGRMTACQLASIGPTAAPPEPYHQPHHQSHHQPHYQRPSYPSSSDTLSRKIYVGNVHHDIDGARLLEFFSRYGEIEEGPLGFDRHTGKPKGFALFIYRTQEGARKALEEPNKNFDGQLLYCQKATDGQRNRAAAAAAAAAPTTPTGSSMQGGGGYVMQGPPGYSMPPGGTGYNGAMDMGMSQGIMGGPMAAFGQAMPANAAALAMLAAAGQNPAAYGVPPALFASLNPALAAAMGGAAQPMAMQAAMPAQGYNLTGAGYQNASYQAPAQTAVNQGGVTYQAVPIGPTQSSRPQMGSMGGYGQH